MHTTSPIFKFSVLALFISMSASSFVVAQSTTTMVTDGSNDTSAQTRDYIRSWRGQSSDTQNKVNALGSIVTSSVFLPVLFGVETSNLRSDFGDPRSNGRTHIGNDIMAVKGTPIVSPTAAVVLRFGVGSGEGNYVYTANPGGETFVYMHLDRFAEGLSQGQVLEKGSLIGYVGNTGNASGGAAHLHFEIHDNNNVAIDPHPRLTGTFTIQEKIQYLTKILSMSTDSNTLAQLLVTHFRSTFTQANSLGITLPDSIKNYMSSLPATAPTTSTNTNIPLGDLELGSKSGDVVKLQTYLILKNKGPAALRLSQAGATGNFGTMTQSALIEYQVSLGISPADGYYGGNTRVSIESNPISTTPSAPSTPVTPSVTTPLPGDGIVITRDLRLYSVGEDVRMLQKFLNSKGFTVSLTGSGSTGNETTYFGQATKAAVIRYQIAKNITPSVGYVGPITRQAILIHK